MTSFFGNRGSLTQMPQDQESRKQLLKQQIQQQLAIAHAQELVTKMNEKCFAKCIYKPSTSLSPSDEGCLTRCMDRWLEAFNVVSRSYVARLAKEREAAGALAQTDPLASALGDKPEFI